MEENATKVLRQANSLQRDKENRGPLIRKLSNSRSPPPERTVMLESCWERGERDTAAAGGDVVSWRDRH